MVSAVSYLSHRWSPSLPCSQLPAKSQRVIAQIRERQMCHLYTLLQAVCSVFCSKDTVEEKDGFGAMDGLILDVACGKLFSLTFQEWNNKPVLEDLGRYYTWSLWWLMWLIAPCLHLLWVKGISSRAALLLIGILGSLNSSEAVHLLPQEKHFGQAVQNSLAWELSDTWSLQSEILHRNPWKYREYV